MLARSDILAVRALHEHQRVVSASLHTAANALENCRSYLAGVLGVGLEDGRPCQVALDELVHDGRQLGELRPAIATALSLVSHAESDAPALRSARTDTRICGLVVSRSRSVAVSSLSVWKSTVMPNGMPSSSALRRGPADPTVRPEDQRGPGRAGQSIPPHRA